MTTTFQEQFARIVRLGREDSKSPEAMGLKLGEEFGEFAETILFQCGHLPHKTLKEPPIGEAADVVQNVICILGVLYPGKSAHEIFVDLVHYLAKKTDKWESVMVPRDTGVDITFGELEEADTQPAVMYINLLEDM
jgi:NTP pyrophosphatase (non-canonical NTP hydrolase)